jgi:hypothetical protein
MFTLQSKKKYPNILFYLQSKEKNPTLFPMLEYEEGKGIDAKAKTGILIREGSVRAVQTESSNSATTEAKSVQKRTPL